MTISEDGLPGEVRERLERILIELVGMAARPEIDPAIREELMRLAAQLFSVLGNDGRPGRI